MTDPPLPHSNAAFPHLEECLAMMEEHGGEFHPAASLFHSTDEMDAGAFQQLSEMAAHLTPVEEIQESPEAAPTQAHGLMQGLTSLPGGETTSHSAIEEWTEEALAKRGVSLTVGGVLLLILAMLLAIRLPAPWVEWAAMKSDWLKHLALAQTWLTSWGVLALVAAGVGSWQRRRWAVPLIHAGGWLAAISVLMSLAVASGGFFFFVPHETPADKAALVGIGTGLMRLGLFGVVAPLLLIAIYQRRHLLLVCDLRDPHPRWTDGLSEPLLMLWMCGVAGALALGAMWFFNSAFPLMGTMAEGLAGKCCLLAGMAGLLVSAWLVARQQKEGWWILWLMTFLLTGSAVWTFLKMPWNQVLAAFGNSAASSSASEPSRMAALLAASLFAPLAMVLLMSRNSFPEEEGPEET